MNRVSITSDYSVSPVIKGGWQLSTGHTPGALQTHENMIADMDAFREAGITTLDFGDIYLGVEQLIGEYLADLQNRFGEKARDLIQLHTKYVPDINALKTHTPADARAIMRRSLERLGVDRLDLVQFHWWDYAEGSCVAALKSLQALQREGMIRLIGVTNFDVSHMQEFVDAGVTPSTIQLQYSVLDHRPENGMSAFCAKHDIKMLCYGTVAGGFLSERYLGQPEPVEPFPNRSLVKYKLIIDEFGGWDLFQELLQALQTVGQKHGCDIGTVASAYILGRPQVASVIVGARDSSHLVENARIASLQLDETDFAVIQSVVGQSIGPSGDVYHLERYSDRHSSIMHKANNSKK